MVTIPFLVLAGPSDPITPLDDLKAALRAELLARQPISLIWPRVWRFGSKGVGLKSRITATASVV